MTKVKPIACISSISGKLVRNEDVYLATNRKTGRMYGVHVVHPYHGPWSEKQVAHRKAFAQRSKTASEWLRRNDPNRNGGTATDEYRAMKRKYDAQHKIGNVFAFVAKHYENGKIKSFL